MTVDEAIRNRFSCRSFLSREVPREVLEDILKTAFRSPSCENSQPWKVYVAGPGAMNQLRTEYENNRKAKVPADLNNRFDGKWSDEMLLRIDEYFDGICEHEPRRNFDYTMQKRNLFYAPCVVFVCMDKRLSAWSYYDIGAFSQSLMLSATEHGLATIPAAVFVGYPDLIRKVLDIPEEKAVIIGIGIGYPDLSVKVNHFKSSRKPISEVVYRGVR